jgi:hypothetical protein
VFRFSTCAHRWPMMLVSEIQPLRRRWKTQTDATVRMNNIQA